MTEGNGRRLRPAARTDVSLFLLRLILAAIFGAYGYAKWNDGLDRFTGLLMSAHIPLPYFAARFVAALEFGGAILLLAGLGTRMVGLLLAIEMAVAIVKVDWARGFLGGFAFELLLLTVALSLAIAGGGMLSMGRDNLSR